MKKVLKEELVYLPIPRWVVSCCQWGHQGIEISVPLKKETARQEAKVFLRKLLGSGPEEGDLEAGYGYPELPIPTWVTAFCEEGDHCEKIFYECRDEEQDYGKWFCGFIRELEIFIRS